MSRASNDRQEFRCCVPAENSAGKLRIGARSYGVCVLNTSRTGFGVRVPNSVAKKLRRNRRLILLYAGEKWEVEPTSRYSEDSQSTNLGLTRLRDLTNLTETSRWTGWAFANNTYQTDPTFLAFLVLAFLVAVVSLPGIGDSLGTAPRVRELLHSVIY